MVRWEYYIFREDAGRGLFTLAKQLNELGSEGWELITRDLVTRGGDDYNNVTYEFIFKRPITSRG